MADSLANGQRQLVDATNKSCAIEMLTASQPWINNAVRTWSSNMIRRYNVGGFVRLTNWAQNWVTFDAIVTSGAFGDALMTVVVDGMFYQAVTLTTDARNHTYTVVGLPIKADGTSVVDIREKWGGNPSTQNTGADSARDGGYITGVQVPSNYTIRAASSPTVGIITVGDSTLGSVGVTASQATLGNWGSVATSLSVLAHAKGWLLTQLEYGGACLMGDGLTAANYVTLIQQAAACMGNPALIKVFFCPFRNDWANNGSGLSTTPTQGQTFMQNIVNGLPSAYQKFGSTLWPNDSEGSVNGFTPTNWRASTALVTGMAAPWIDGTALGLLAADRSDGIHLKASGVAKVLAAVQPPLGL